MSLTLLEMKDSHGTVTEVYLDIDSLDDKTWTLKQYDQHSCAGEWIELSRPMLLQLRDWITKELGP